MSKDRFVGDWWWLGFLVVNLFLHVASCVKLGDQVILPVDSINLPSDLVKVVQGFLEHGLEFFSVLSEVILLSEECCLRVIVGQCVLGSSLGLLHLSAFPGACGIQLLPSALIVLLLTPAVHCKVAHFLTVVTLPCLLLLWFCHINFHRYQAVVIFGRCWVFLHPWFCLLASLLKLSLELSVIDVSCSLDHFVELGWSVSSHDIILDLFLEALVEQHC